MLKAEWERNSEKLQIDAQTIEAMVHVAFPHETMHDHSFISTGCANANIKVMLADRPIILRIYMRDKDAGLREQKVFAWVGDAIPIPEIFYVGEYQAHSYALVEYAHGVVLRDVILKGVANIDDIMIELGRIAAKMQKYTFPQAGMLDGDLSPIPRATGYAEFASECLQYPHVIKTLGEERICRFEALLQQYAAHFPDPDQSYLVHGDYDPANILVQEINGKWKVSAILDWEFAFSGAWLFDVSNMLRYAHQLPNAYEKCFIQGLENGGCRLPDDWKITIMLLNALSLLDLLSRHSQKEHPKQCADILALLEHNVQEIQNA